MAETQRTGGWLDTLPPDARLLGPGAALGLRPELRARGDALAAALQRLGIGAGDRVVVLLPRGRTQFLTTLLCSGTAVAAPFSPQQTRAEIVAHLERVRPAAAILDATLVERCRDLCLDRGISVISARTDLSLAIEPAGRRRAGPDPGSTAGRGLLLPTSGTTGEAKLVHLSDRQLQRVAGRIARSVGLGPGDSYLCVLPGWHIHGFSTALAALRAGGAVSFPANFEAGEVLASLRRDAISWLSATPTHYRALLDALDGAEAAFPALRFLRSASAPMDAALSERVAARFRVPVVQAYGMTEAGPLIATNTLEAGGNRPGSVGRPCGVEVLIGRPGAALPAAVSGDVWIRGDSVSTAYWPAPDTAEAGAGTQWLCTGDLGYLDADGFLHITGRRRELINAGGEKLLPRVIEATLEAHPAVREAVVYPAPHDSLGEAPRAAVVLRPSPAAAGSGDDAARGLLAAIRQHCVDRLPLTHVPHRIIVIGELPVDAGGKLPRRRLHEHFLSRRPAPDRRQDRAADSSAALRETVRQCWQRALRRAEPDGADNFFMLGGDSLSAAALVLAFEHRLGLRLENDFPFRWPTLAQQVEALAACCRGADRECPPAAAGAERLGEIVPLSDGQRRLWLLEELGAGAQYTMCSPLWIDGVVDREALQLALSDVVARHGVLRSCVKRFDSRPVQYIARTLIPELVVRDLRGPDAQDRVRDVAEQALAQRLDPAAVPPVRYALLRVAETRYAFLLTIHHLFCDGWSVAVFYRDLLLRYAHRVGAGAPSLPALRADYRDFCYAQQTPASRADREKRRWWADALAAAAAGPPLFPAAAGSGAVAARRRFPIDAETGVALQRVAAGHGSSTYALLLAALQLAVAAASGRERFCVGTVAANRGRGDFDDCLGFFANTLALPASVKPASSLDGFVRAVAAMHREALARADVDLSRIVSDLAPPRHRDANPFPEVMFAYQNYPSLASRLEGVDGPLRVSPFTVEGRLGRFPLSLYLTPDGDGFSGVWVYRTAALGPAVLDRIAATFRAAVQAIVHEAPIALGDLLPAPAPRARAGGRAAGVDLLRRIAIAAERSPAAPAVRCGTTTLSYGQLVREVDRLAAAIEAAGAGPGARVGVLLPRCLEAVVAPLAVWSRGASYVPLDATLPRPRIEYMAVDAGVSLLLHGPGDDALAGALAEAVGGRVVDCRALPAAGAAADVTPVTPADHGPAYILYTSGTTGTPKGVEISFANIRYYFRALSRALGLGSDDVYLHSASLSFSSSIRQFALPLYVGGCVCVAAGEDVANAASLPRLAAAAGVTVMDLVPSHWRNVLRAAALSATPVAFPGAVRLLLSASEALDTGLASELAAAFPGARLVNMYGQTETAGIVLINTAAGTSAEDRFIALGSPLDGNSVAVVDADGSEVAAGTVGELVVAGPSVGLGYLGAARDGAGAFSERGALPAFRTGDLVRQDGAGSVHYVGRVDAQISYRGFRIEPGDIEAVASRHPGVRHPPGRGLSHRSRHGDECRDAGQDRADGGRGHAAGAGLDPRSSGHAQHVPRRPGRGAGRAHRWPQGLRPGLCHRGAGRRPDRRRLLRGSPRWRRLPSRRLRYRPPVHRSAARRAAAAADVPAAR